MTREELDTLWNDPASWRAGIFYVQPRDPRILVKRRYTWGGWTVNFGHPRWVPALMALIAAPGLLMAMALALGLSQLSFLIVMLFTIGGVIWVARWEESRPRD